MKHFIASDLGRLRLLAFLEGTSLLLMVFVTVPLRVFLGIDQFSKILGPIHGMLFLLFVLNTFRVAVEQRWAFRRTTWKVLLACLIPFGTFYIDFQILRPLHQKLIAQR